jgi:CHAD domain-containing protein
LHADEYQKCLAKTWKRLHKKIRPVSFHWIENYFKKELAAIPNHLAQNNNDSIHEGRKKLKNLLYLYRMLPGPMQKKLLLQIDHIDNLQDKIGKWHDLVLAEPILRKRISSMQMVIIRREKEDLLEESRKMTEHFLEKVKISAED